MIFVVIQKALLCRTVNLLEQENTIFRIRLCGVRMWHKNNELLFGLVFTQSFFVIVKKQWQNFEIIGPLKLAFKHLLNFNEHSHYLVVSVATK